MNDKKINKVNCEILNLTNKFNKTINIIFLIKIIIISLFLHFFFFIGFYIRKTILTIKVDKKEIKQYKVFYKELKNFISYSQFYEDLILFTLFYDIKNGFYIDIGANDPNDLSITKSFYLRGWYGLNIEPLPAMYNMLIKYRNRDINLQIGVGEKEGNQILYANGFSSTLNKNYSNDINEKINISIYTMKYICNKYIPKGEIIQFCKIDIEGNEKNALLGYDFINYRPKIFCIESTKPGTTIPTHEEWEDILLKNDFSFAYQYKINRYYIDNRIKGLRERFILSDYAIKIFSERVKK